MRRVSAKTARPERPPRPVASRGSATGLVFDATTPSASFSIATDASATTASRSASVRNGGSFTNSGVAPRWRTAESMSERCVSTSTSLPQETFGQLTLSSKPSTKGWSRSRFRATAPASSSARLTSSAAGPRRRRRASRSATTSTPGFGSPIAFVIDRRCGYLAMRGLAFPSRGAVVTVPPTTKPKPSEPSGPKRPHPLSKPAARPIGFRSASPATVVRSDGSIETPPTADQGSGRPSRRRAIPCAVSGGKERKSGRPIARYQLIALYATGDARAPEGADRGRRPGSRGTPPRGLGAPRRLRALLGQALGRLLRQVPFPHRPRPAEGARRGGRGAPPAGHHASRRAGGCRHAPRRRDGARHGPPGRGRAEGGEGLRNDVAGGGPRAGGRDDRADRGRQHDGEPGAEGGEDPRGRGVHDRHHPARDRPRRRRSPRAGGILGEVGREARPGGVTLRP